MVPTWQWIAIVVGVFGAAFFSGSETALTALGEAKAQALVDSGSRRARLLKLWIEHPDRVLVTLLLGNTLVNVGMGASTALIADELGYGKAVAAVTGLTTIVILVAGEVLPKTFAKRHAAGVSVAAIPFVALTYYATFPLVWLLAQFPRGLTRVLGVQPVATDAVTSRELEYLIEMGAKHGSLDAMKEQLLSSVLAFTDMLVREIMVPRTQVVALEETATYDETMKLAVESELSRIPVYRETMDEVVGILYVKTLLVDVQRGKSPKEFQLSKYLKKPFYVPEVMKVSRLLTEMQRRKTHLAIVVDEFGGTSGIVTLEDVMEEIVGEIHDESDIEEKRIKVLSDGIVIADAAVALRELEEHLNVDFPDRIDYETLGGFLTATAGRVPPAGSLVVWGGLTFTVKAADERRVLKVEIAKKPATASAPPASEKGAEKVAEKVPPHEKVH